MVWSGVADADEAVVQFYSMFIGSGSARWFYQLRHLMSSPDNASTMDRGDLPLNGA
jgi:hypothetical protein